ncbi:hypothetical protein SAE02_13760 [Skermanella aerolata]|uniref:Large ribosomal subunit protein bL36 n=31 Tax=Alphaproteobacteria TaxID=28211 RepID=A0A512DL99_9PROT|nr:hypothetical protein SAE02_13760 [Skermanella aerolata]
MGKAGRRTPERVAGLPVLRVEAGRWFGGLSPEFASLYTPKYRRLLTLGVRIHIFRRSCDLASDLASLGLETMKIVNSLKSMKTRHKACRVIRRKGRVYVINKQNPRFKARQG